MAIRTYAWIARQPYNVRYMPDGVVLTDDTPESASFAEEHSKPVFKRGELWPSLCLVEKSWEDASKKSTDIFIRVYKKRYQGRSLIIDVFQGNDIDIITGVSETYSIPIYSITTSKRTGKRGSVQKLLDFQD